MNNFWRAFAGMIAGCLFLSLSVGATAQAITESVSSRTVNGNPAIVITGHVSINNRDDVYSSVVERGGTADDPALLFHFMHLDHNCYGNLEVSAHHVRWSPPCEKHPFDLDPADIQFTNESTDEFDFQAKGKKYGFVGGEKDKQFGTWKNPSDMLRSLFQQSVQDFQQALMSFERMRGDKLTAQK
jgi:hypothetical protein